MASKRTVDLLLTDLGKVMGLPDLAFDENDGCLLQFDDSLTALILYDGEAGVLYFFSYVGAILDQAMGTVAPKLLEANYRWQDTGGATLSLRPGSENDVVMTQKFRLADMDAQKLQEHLGTFVMHVEKWTKFIDESEQHARPSKPVAKENANLSAAPSGAIRA